IGRSGHIDLCEGFAERICTVCLADPRVERARVWVEKLDVFSDAEGVGAMLERTRPADKLGRAVPPACLFGIVNITEDSFSDGGRYLDPSDAIAHARALVAAGAQVIDLGAAASNVAAQPVTAAEEIRRLDPVMAVLAGPRAHSSLGTVLS